MLTMMVITMMKSTVAFYSICSDGKLGEGYYFEPKQAFDFDESGRKYEEA